MTQPSIEPQPSGATKTTRIAEALREVIATGKIERGARLYQDQLAEEFDTSITPVREALKLLQAEGLLVGEPHRGVRVASPNIDQIASIYVMRRLVEPYAARRASPRLARRDYDRARRINDEFQAVDPEDAHEARRLNHDFHFAFYNACGLPTLVSEIERLWTGFPWAALQVRRGRALTSVDEHEAMLDAVMADDQEAIQQLFETHIKQGFTALMDHIGVTVYVDPFDDREPGGNRSLREGDSWWSLSGHR